MWQGSTKTTKSQSGRFKQNPFSGKQKGSNFEWVNLQERSELCANNGRNINTQIPEIWNLETHFMSFNKPDKEASTAQGSFIVDLLFREWQREGWAGERVEWLRGRKRERSKAEERGGRKVSRDVCKMCLTLSCVCYSFSYFFDGFSMQIHPLFITLCKLSPALVMSWIFITNICILKFLYFEKI